MALLISDRGKIKSFIYIIMLIRCLLVTTNKFYIVIHMLFLIGKENNCRCHRYLKENKILKNSLLRNSVIIAYFYDTLVLPEQYLWFRKIYPPRLNAPRNQLISWQLQTPPVVECCSADLDLGRPSFPFVSASGDYLAQWELSAVVRVALVCLLPVERSDRLCSVANQIHVIPRINSRSSKTSVSLSESRSF